MISQKAFKSLIRNVLGYGSRVRVVRGILTTLHVARHRHQPWMRKHPFDILYGTTTNGMLPAWLLRSGEVADIHVTAYAGCQPSCLRRALGFIPDTEYCTFVDLGCGKGRALIVASELPFVHLLGIELAPDLVKIARRNAQIIQRNYPQRTAIEIVKGDATAVPLPEGPLVIFLCHSFGPEMVGRMLSRIVDAVVKQDRVVFLIYENPVYGQMVDNIAAFTRWYCDNVPYAPSELGFGPDESETVVVWRIGGTLAVSPQSNATRPIVIKSAGWRAEVEESKPDQGTDLS